MTRADVLPQHRVPKLEQRCRRNHERVEQQNRILVRGGLSMRPLLRATVRLVGLVSRRSPELVLCKCPPSQHLASSTLPSAPSLRAQPIRLKQRANPKPEVAYCSTRPDPTDPQFQFCLKGRWHMAKEPAFQPFGIPLPKFPPWLSLQCLILTPHLRFSNFLLSIQEELLFCDGRDHINPHVFWPASSRVSNFP